MPTYVTIPDQMGLRVLQYPPTWFRKLRPNQYRVTEFGQQWLRWRREGWPLRKIMVEANGVGDQWREEDVRAFFELADARPLLLLDVDGVLADFLTPCLRAAAEVGPLRSVAYPEWDGRTETFPTWGVFDVIDDPEQHEAFLAEWDRIGFALDLEPYPEAQEGVALVRQFANLACVTAAPRPRETRPKLWNWHWERLQWLEDHFNIPLQDVVFASRKDLVLGDVLVDDRASNVRAWAAAHPEGQAILWDQSYNQHEEVPEGVVRTLDWNEVLSAVLRAGT